MLVLKVQGWQVAMELDLDGICWKSRFRISRLSIVRLWAWFSWTPSVLTLKMFRRGVGRYHFMSHSPEIDWKQTYSLKGAPLLLPLQSMPGPVRVWHKLIRLEMSEMRRRHRRHSSRGSHSRGYSVELQSSPKHKDVLPVSRSMAAPWNRRDTNRMFSLAGPRSNWHSTCRWTFTRPVWPRLCGASSRALEKSPPFCTRTTGSSWLWKGRSCCATRRRSRERWAERSWSGWRPSRWYVMHARKKALWFARHHTWDEERLTSDEYRVFLWGLREVVQRDDPCSGNLMHFQEQLTILEKVDPGYPDWRGSVLKHYSTAELFLTRMDFDAGLIGRPEFLLRCRKAACIVQEGLRCTACIKVDRSIEQVALDQYVDEMSADSSSYMSDASCCSELD